ncbi:type II secretion system secretin GspD [Gilvimarinus sp. SDUM040013]|uniref:Type II secretion system secretin GspD n=1 Tax=Gilvimarinus gilvus TaxID=3058038 RepID=A0ABU4RWG9_9GAMM|nr:type II secretion system secretin GspD [Gilvimarinus sp. SDUM040013]MDO3385239.1 type II secretion system secretin GspD [Gilvimarinus sp. SDUM040013]MDX6849222.1 type II secretion system secretin GspD [Gilvimarinus sp. SDUM040013]
MNRVTWVMFKSSACLMSLLLVGCATPWQKSVDLGVEEGTTVSEQTEEAEQAQVFGADKANLKGDGQDQRREPDLYPGSGRLYKAPEARSPIAISGNAVMVNFDASPLEDVIHGVLGDILGLDYIIETPVTGTVTLRSRGPIDRDELLMIVEAFLRENGLVMIRGGNAARYVITAAENANRRMPRYNNLNDTGAGFSNVIVPLEHIGAQEMVDILTPVAPETAFIRVDGVRNLLILAGTRGQMDGWLDIVEMFDVDVLSGMSVGIFPVEYSSVEEILSALTSVMSSMASGGEEQLSGLVNTIPLESLGSILVVTPKKAYLKRVGDWIEKLDKAPESGAEPQLYVYEVQNGNADHLAHLISSVFGGTGGSGSLSRQSGRGVSPGLTPSSLTSDAGSTTGAAGAASQSSNRHRNSTASGASSYSFGDTAKIVADQVNNSLLIYATSTEYKKISSALKSLDIMPSQILIEASIIEVRLTDNLEYGLEWYFDNEFNGGRSGVGNVGFNVDGSGEFSGSIPNFGYAFTNSIGSIQAVLNVLAGKNLLKVLSTPSLMVLDNQSASIQVGNSTAVLSSTTAGDYGSTQNVTYRDTGVQLDVTPSVNAGGLVTMEIQQSVSNQNQGAPGAAGNPSFFERSIQSKVAVRSGESVILGGLISDTESSAKSGLPFFSDLPLIGWMFGGTTIEEERQELLVIITPHVMKTDQDLRDVTKEMRSRMKGLEAFEQSIDSSRLVNE